MSSGLGVVPKKNGKRRLIHHLSAPIGNSITAGIAKLKEDYSLHYVTVDHAIAIIIRLGHGGPLAKTSIPNAFSETLPSALGRYPLLGIAW